MSLELVYPECPNCNRILKPSIEPGILHITEYPKKVVKKIDLHDILICRYCNIYIKVEVLREQKDPITFLKQFTKIPKEREISKEEKEKIRLREDHRENMEKYKHSPIPERCPYCKSEDIIADSYDYGWICLSCDDGFEWESYRINFYGDIDVEAENPDQAREKGYEYLKKGYGDIETEVDKFWRG